MLLIIELTVILLLCFLYQRKHKWLFASPFFLLCVSVSVSLVIMLLNYENWTVTISYRFVLYLTTAVCVWYLGDYVSERLLKKNDGLLKKCILRPNISNIYFLIIISFVFSLIFAGKSWEVVPIGSSLTYGLRLIYDNITLNDYSPGFIANQLREITIAGTYVSVFYFFTQWISEKKYSIKDYIFAFISICSLGIIVMFSTDRNIFIRFIIYLLVLFILFFEDTYSSRRKKIELISFIVVIGFVSLLIFYFFGKTKNYKSGLFRALSIYGGSGLNNLNIWLNNYDGVLSYGTNTFSALINTIIVILDKIGVSISYVMPNRFDQYIKYTSLNGYVYSSNIYSALIPYIKDFGFIGVLIFPFATGLFYGTLYRYSKNHKAHISWILYAMLVYPIIFYPIAEQLFKRLHLGLLYEFFWIICIYNLVYRCNIFRKKKDKQ